MKDGQIVRGVEDFGGFPVWAGVCVCPCDGESNRRAAERVRKRREGGS